MVNQPGQTPETLESWKRGLFLVGFACDVLSVSVIVFIRKNFGERFIQWQAAAALLVIAVFSAFFPGEDCSGLGWFLFGYVLFLARAKLERIWSRWRGRPPEHSFYNGECRLFSRFGGLKETTVKTYFEPILVLGIGILVNYISHPLGVYLMICAPAMFISSTLCSLTSRALELDFQDSILSSQNAADRFRSQMRRDDDLN